MKLQTLLLAAGEGSRFGDVKQLTEINGLPMVVHCYEQLAAANTGSICICLGAYFDQVAAHLPQTSSIIQITNWQVGMGESIKCGIESLHDDTSHVLIALGDQVAVTTAHFNRLVQFAEDNSEYIVAAKYAETFGVPVIFPRQYFVELTRLPLGKGAKSLIRQHNRQVLGVDMPEAVVDIDTKHDKEAWKNGQCFKPGFR